MHTCCCILFTVLIGFDPNAKWFENLFENAFGKSNWKMKRNFYSFSFSSFLFGLLAHPLSKARTPPLHLS
jgi:hypothetical protein